MLYYLINPATVSVSDVLAEVDIKPTCQSVIAECHTPLLMLCSWKAKAGTGSASPDVSPCHPK